MLEFYRNSQDSVIQDLKTSRNGLKNEDVSKRIAEYGMNELKLQKKKTMLYKLLNQFKNLTVLILIIAAIISGLLGEITDMIIILFVVILNAALGVIQEDKAEKSLDALKKLSQPFATVLRDKKHMSVRSSQLVPGDIVILETGSIVPADMRLLDSASLRIDESTLTGESMAVEKDALDDIEKTLPLGDRTNMAYSGCSVLYGRAVGVVTATGMNTEVGKIASMLNTDIDEKTPLEKKLTVLGKYISIGVVVIALIIFFIGLIGGRSAFDMFITSVALAVAAIPEGLPAIVTIVLAIGVQKMARKNAIVRKLPAVETLGGTQIICSDKTGTLTQNKMLIKEVFFNGIHFKRESDIRKGSMEFDFLNKIIVLCNDALPTEDGYTGDPTEIALLEFSRSYGYEKVKLNNEYPRITELPFDSKRKLMTTFHNISDSELSLTKGAPDILIKRCSRILINEEIESITQEHILYIQASNDDMSSRALRVLGAAYNDNESAQENGMVFVGLIGMMDPPRDEALLSVQKTISAGILPIMITGDHVKTAFAIAHELGIASDESQILSGEELESLSDEEFSDRLYDLSVYARVSPEHKVKIVKAWKAKNKVVAMTGDGVNDAPALRIADIGVGMGITGTEVSKSVSDIILTDDNYSTIVSAVEEGRKIFSNIRKSIQFLLSANIGEVITLFVATLLNWTILFPIHILWINLVTDTLPAIALGMEKAEDNIMKRPPSASNSFFQNGFISNVIYQGTIEAAIVLLVFMISRSAYSSESISITMAFVTLGLIQLCHAFNVKSEGPVLRKGFFNNKYLNIGAAISALLQLSVVFIPFLNDLFRVVSLAPFQWIICIFASMSILLFVEMIKFTKRYFSKRTIYEV